MFFQNAFLFVQILIIAAVAIAAEIYFRASRGGGCKGAGKPAQKPKPKKEKKAQKPPVSRPEPKQKEKREVHEELSEIEDQVNAKQKYEEEGYRI